MSWKKEYQQKLVSVEEAASKIESGDKVWFNGLGASPIRLVEAISKRWNELENVDMVCLLVMEPYEFISNSKCRGHINYKTMFLGPIDRPHKSNVEVNSVAFHKSDVVLRDVYKIDTLLADVAPPDEDGYMSLGAMGVAWGGDVMTFAKKIIVNVNKNEPQNYGQFNKIHVSQVDWICESDAQLTELKQPAVRDTDKKIASHIIPMIEDGSTLQVGLGGIANAVAYGLEEHRNLAVHTELLTESMVYLAKKGVINRGILAAFAIGTTEVYSYVANPQVKLAPIYLIINPFTVGKNEKLVSINSTLMVDLTGQACSESIGFNQFSGIGGQSDFVRAAGISKGGKSFLCLASTNTGKDGTVRSNITAQLPPGAVVSVPRYDVMYIVTEYGVADLYNRPITERTEAMINIAHPDFRDQLRAEAKKVGLIP